MLHRFIRFTLILTLIAVCAAPVLAQGTQFGTIRGTVTLPDGSPVPGAQITATSPALLGERTVYATSTGEYIIRALPPGNYTLSFTLEGMSEVESSVVVSLGQVTPGDVEMQPEAIEETIVVTGEESSVLASSEVSTTYNYEEIESLPIAKTPASVAAMAPGLTTNTPNGGQVTISGGFAYDNIFLIDGVDANDNLFGSSNPVYIEEAIADVQVLTSGISAEFGRFSGGVVNITTKSGGNQFSGSLRGDFTNEDWREKTPVEEEDGTELVDKTNEFLTATFGGYLLRDQLWFFAAGRDESTETQDTFSATGLPEPNSTDEERWEGKLTWNIADRHQLQGQFTDREQTGLRGSFSFSATPDTLRTRVDPSDLLVARYNGALSDSLFGELQYSEKTFTFMNSHGDEGLVESSPFFAFFGVPPGTNAGNFDPATDPFETPSVHHNAPYFDGTDPEDRNNEQATGALSWFTDTANAGSHDIKVGVEDFTSTRIGGNSQSPTSVVFDAGAVTDANGEYVITDGRLTPIFAPGVTYIEQWLATRGAEINIETLSTFVNDRWRLNDHWSFNVGVRYEQIESDATGGIVTVDTDRIVPRLGASYDVRGDGKYRLDATYAQYSGKYSESQFANNTTVGNPRGVFSIYAGPYGVGRDFAPGFDLSNYVPFAASDGTANLQVADDIQSPVVTEYTLSGGMELARGGYLKAVYTNREYEDFVETFICAAAAGIPCPGPGDTGVVNVVVEGIEVGPANVALTDNSDIPTREYEAIQLLGRHVFTDRWDLNGSWTYQLANEGNFEGEGTNTPGIDSTFGDNPGYFIPSRHFPTGDLNGFQEHKLRLWTTYRFGLGRAGELATTLLANYDSARHFDFTALIPDEFTAEQQRINSFYVSPETGTQSIFFGPRGSGEYEDSATFDLGLVYSLPIVPDWGMELLVDFEVINILNDDSLIEYNTDISGVLDGPTDANGFPTQFTRGASFGQGQENDHFPDPRAYRFGVGIRF